MLRVQRGMTEGAGAAPWALARDSGSIDAVRSIGPRLPLRERLDENADPIRDGAVIGGNLMYYQNLELEFPLLEAVNIRGVVFTDLGNAWNLESVYCNAAPASPYDESNPCFTFDRLFAVNVKGTFNTLREAAGRLQPGGRIVNFSTSVIGLALPGYAVYGATKSAVETFTHIMAKELRGKNIRVNAIAPGPTATALFLNGKTPETIERMSKMAPLERLGTPEDIASAVVFLVSDDAGWVNGQTLRANGGVI